MAVLVMFYAMILGVTSASRSSFIFIMTPVVIYAWIDRKRFMYISGSLATLVIYQLVTLSRTITYSYHPGNIASTVYNLSFYDLLVQLPSKIVNIVNYDLFAAFLNIINRIESAEGLVLASHFNSDAIGGAHLFILRMIWNGLAFIDQDLYHTELLGYALPFGFAAGGCLSAWVLYSSNGNIWIVAVSTLIVAVQIMIIETTVFSVFNKYKFPKSAALAVVVVLTFFLYLGPGTIFYIAPVLILIALRIMPPLIAIKRHNAPKAPRS